MSVIDEVKQKIDIAEVIGQYTALKKAGRNLTALCPFHSEKHPSFMVYPEQQSWHCFGACNTGGDVFAFLMKKENLDFPEALHQLAQRAGVTLPSKPTLPGKKEDREEFFQVNEAASLYFHNLLLNSRVAEIARKYISKRGFTQQTIIDFQLGFSQDSWEGLKNYLTEKGYSQQTMLAAGLLIEGENGRIYDRFRGKLMIPIREIRGRVTGFGARVLDDSLPKYVNSPQSPTFDKSSTLYAIDRAAGEIRKQDRTIIMEGYMDVITAHQNGITNVVASMGTAITETQVNILKKLSHNLILALDADTAGEEAMLRTTGHENILNHEMHVVIMPEGKDPDDVIREDLNRWKELVEKSLPLMDFMFDKTKAGIDLSTAGGKSAVVDRLLPVVADIKDPVRQMHYLQKLASLVKVDLNTIKASLNRLKAPQTRRGQTLKNPMMKASIINPGKDVREEYLLTLLIKHPELKDLAHDLSVYLENTENREIYSAWLETGDPAALKEILDPSLHEYLDDICNRTLPDGRNNAEQRYLDCVLEMERRYYRNKEAQRAEMLALEAVSGGPGADIARLEVEGIEPSTRLRDLDLRKGKKRNTIPNTGTRS